MGGSVKLPTRCPGRAECRPVGVDLYTTPTVHAGRSRGIRQAGRSTTSAAGLATRGALGRSGEQVSTGPPRSSGVHDYA